MEKNLQNKNLSHQPISGFTILELLIVIAILGILGSLMWGNFFSSISKGRDSKRKQDLSSLAKALELYYNDFRSYPNPDNPLPTWGTPFANPTNTAVIYMENLPTDPAYPGASYCYSSDTGGTYYLLYANLENTNDPKIFATPVVCNNTYYNYGIGSPNAAP